MLNCDIRSYGAVGDGAAMNGKPLMILDSGSEMVNEYTIQGYQEVEMPDGFEPTDEIEIEMSILYGMSVYCQDENNVYFSHLMTPENRGIFRLPFKVNLNGQTEAYAGSVTTGAYSAQATIRVSDVDISGEVVFDAPEWAEAFEAGADGKHEMKMPYINSYTLVADGVEREYRIPVASDPDAPTIATRLGVRFEAASGAEFRISGMELE